MVKYIHVRNLEKYHPGYKEEITAESHLEKFILSQWKDIFPFKHIATRKKINKGCIVDLLGEDEENFYIIELKFRPIRKKDIKQVNRYGKGLNNKDKNIKKFLIGYNHKDREINICHTRI